MAKKTAEFTNFTFRFEETLRKRAAELADEKGWSLGQWVGRLIAREVATLDAEHPPSPTPTRRARKPVT